jgi:hypothetical protein
MRPELAYQIAYRYNYNHDLHDPELVSKLARKPLREAVVHLLDKSARMWLNSV